VVKLIRSGGTNAALGKSDTEYATHGFGNYFMLQIKAELDAIIDDGGVIALCVAAKENKQHYDERLVDIGFRSDNFEIIGKEDEVDWGRYNAVLMLGGETKELYSWLIRTNFNKSALTNCQLLEFDSAGAYVLSGKTLIDYMPDGSSFEIVEGFLPKLNQVIAAHVNNLHYHKLGLSKALSAWCMKHDVEYIELEENELIQQEI
jgi:hypothetical protein